MREGLCEAEELFSQFGYWPAIKSGTIYNLAKTLFNSIL